MQPSASKASLLLECSYSFDPDLVIPHGEPGEAAIYGQFFHKAMEARVLFKDPGPEDDYLAAHARASFKHLWAWLGDNGWLEPHKSWVEAPLAYCPRTATARHCSPPDEATHVYPDLRVDELAGTADLIIVPTDKSRAILILDHKTGVWGDFSRPERLPQLLALGTAACLLFGRDRFEAAILHSPRDGTPIVYSSDELSLSDKPVREFNERLRAQLSRIGDGSLRPGAHCKYCPARTVCPAKATELLDQASQLVEKATLVGSELVLVSNDNKLSKGERIGRLHLMMARFSELKERATQEIKRELVENPELEAIRPDGKTLGLETRSAETLSKASIIRALGKVEGERLIQELRARGCVETSERVELRAK